MSLKLFKRKGSENWYMRGTICGRNVFESTGVSERSVAEAILVQRSKEILDESVFGKKATATGIEAFLKYIESGGERRFLPPLVDRLGRLRLSEINQATIDRVALELYPHATDSTRARQVYAPMVAVLKHAARCGLCDPPLIRRPKVPKGRVRWITPEEAERLIEECAQHLKPLVLFLLGTGARLGEALYIDWRNVDLERAQVQFIDTKNGESRGVPLHPRLVAALSALSHREGAVFLTDEGKPYARKEDCGGQIKTGFTTACRNAGINDFSPHGCRHTWATWTYAATRNLGALMELGGWKSPAMVMRYAHLNVGHLEAITNALPWTTGPEIANTRVGSRGRVR